MDGVFGRRGEEGGGGGRVGEELTTIQKNTVGIVVSTL